MRPMTQPEAAAALAAIASPAAQKSVAEGSALGGVLLDYSGSYSERLMYKPLLYQLIRHTGTIRLSLANTLTTQGDVNAIVEQVADLHAAEGWYPKINIQDSPYFQGGVGFHGAEPVNPTSDQYDTAVTNYITGKLADFWTWLWSAATTHGITDWLTNLTPATDVIYCFDHEVWNNNTTYSWGPWDDTLRQGHADRIDVIVAAYESHTSPPEGGPGFGGGKYIWYQYEGIEITQGLDGFLNPPPNLWLPTGGGVPDLADRLFPNGQNVRQSYQTWHTMYPYLIAQLVNLNEEHADTNGIPETVWWTSINWNRALDITTYIDDVNYMAPVRGRDIRWLGRHAGRGVADGTIINATRISMVAFWPAILNRSNDTGIAWGLNGFVNFMLGLVKDEVTPTIPMLGDGVYDEYPAVTAPTVLNGEVVLEADPHRAQDSATGTRFHIYQRMPNQGNDWLRWTLSEIRAQWDDPSSLLDATNMQIPVLVEAYRGPCYEGIRLSHEDIENDAGDPEQELWTSKHYYSDQSYKYLIAHIPPHLQGRPGLRFRAWRASGATPKDLRYGFTDTGRPGGLIDQWYTETPPTLVDGTLHPTDWIDVPDGASAIMLTSNDVGSWMRIYGVDLIDINTPADPDQAVQYDRLEWNSGNAEFDVVETVGRQASLMYDGPNGTAKRVVGGGGLEAAHGTGFIATPEYRIWWGNSVNGDTTKADARSVGGMVGGMKNGSYAINFGEDLNQTFSPAADTARRVKTTRCEIALTGWEAKRNADGSSSKHGDMAGHYRFDGHPGIEIKMEITAVLDLRVWQHWRNVAVTPRDVRWVQSAGTEQDVDVENGTDDTEIAITSYAHPTLTFGEFNSDTMIGIGDKDSQWSPEGQFFEPKDAGHQRLVLEALDRSGPGYATVANGEKITSHYFISVMDSASKRVSNEARA